MEYIAFVIIPQMLHGLVWGMAIVLTAIGLTVIFGLMGVVNFAHGELYMLGAFLGFFFIPVVNSFWISLVISFVIVGCIGLVIEKFTLKPLYGRNPIYALLLTFALSMVLQESARLIWGGGTYRVIPPIMGSVNFLGLIYPKYRLFILLFSAILMFCLYIFFMKTEAGATVRATSQDSQMLSSLGVNVPRVFSLTFAAGSALAAISGLVMAPVFSVYYRMGTDCIIRAFIVVIIGGFGSIKGAVFVGLVIGLIESLSSLWITPTQAETLVFVILIIMLIVRPKGIFSR